MKKIKNVKKRISDVMTKKLILKSLISILVLGGIGAGIGIPVSNYVNKKEDVLKKINLEEIAYTDANGKEWSLKELIEEGEKQEKESISLINDVIKSTVYYLYKNEQQESFEEQIRTFKYEWFKKNETKTKLENKDSLNENEKKELKNINEKLTKLEKKIEWLKNNKTNKKVDYNSSNFKKDYPKVLPSIYSLEEKQGKIFDDKKNAYVESFKTLAEGEAEWIKKMKNDYDGAVSKKEAIASLTYKTIKDDALKRYKLSIIDDYTVEMENAKYKTETENIYPFLDGLTAENNLDLNDDKDKTLYFIGTNSKNSAHIKSNLNLNGEIIAALERKKVVKMNHLLIGAKPNEKGSSLNWIVEKKTIKNLFREYTDENGNKAYLIDLLDENLFKDDEEEHKEKTTFFIENVSDDTGTAKKNGALGIDSIMNLLGDKVPGFVLGVIDGYDNSQVPNEGIQLLTSMKEELKKIVWGEKVSGDWPTERKSLKAMREYIDSMEKEKFDEKFGKLFKKLFKYNDAGSEISYDLGNKTYLTVSKFGIHIINLKSYKTKQEIKDTIDEDIKKIIKEQSTSKSILKYDVLFNDTFSDNNIIKEMLKIQDFVTYLKTGYEKKEDQKETYDLRDFLNTDESKKNWNDVLNEIKYENDNFEKTKALKNLDKVWIKAELGDIINKKRIDKIYEAKPTTTSQAIYEKVLLLSGVKGGS